MEKLDKILKRKVKELPHNFTCPYCQGQSTYAYFSEEFKMARWFCHSCRSEGNLRDLNALCEQNT